MAPLPLLQDIATGLDGEVRSILARRLRREEANIAWESSIAAISDDETLPELWLALEDAFDIDLDDDDVQSVRTARDVVNVVRVRLIERAQHSDCAVHEEPR